MMNKARELFDKLPMELNTVSEDDPRVTPEPESEQKETDTTPITIGSKWDLGPEELLGYAERALYLFRQGAEAFKEARELEREKNAVDPLNPTGSPLITGQAVYSGDIPQFEEPETTEPMRQTTGDSDIDLDGLFEKVFAELERVPPEETIGELLPKLRENKEILMIIARKEIERSRND